MFEAVSIPRRIGDHCVIPNVCMCFMPRHCTTTMLVASCSFIWNMRQVGSTELSQPETGANDVQQQQKKVWMTYFVRAAIAPSSMCVTNRGWE